ncbi:hypothetical protein R1sor_012083 [Riccia sorocarpa]|uniref:FCP1 homology domain-containing protein n=1 Tax=Riccia sorocarpa TaxID=122646 RepID=A0ABD3I6Q9_9MARC
MHELQDIGTRPNEADFIHIEQYFHNKGNLVAVVKQLNTGEHEEDGPLALVLHHSRSLGSSHFEEIPPVPLYPIQSVEAAVPVPPCMLAPIETPISWVLDLNQIPDPIVKASDLLPRKLLILDVEGLLVYVEGFMDRSSKTAAGDVVGTKKVIRRNGVQEFITRCLELFDIAL